MKNILNYYYHIIINDNDLERGYFVYNNHHFCLHEYKRSIDEINNLISLNDYMLTRGITNSQIIMNINNEFITQIDNKNYVLVENNTKKERSIQIPNFLVKELPLLKRNNWDILWSRKIDYIEYQMAHLEKHFPLLNESINYYIGLSENAISYFKMINLENYPLYLSHRRLTKESFNNPLEYVIDYRVRDLAEYLKYLFFFVIMEISGILNFIKRINLNYIDYLLLYTRMLYPSYYFDVYEDIVNNNQEEKRIKEIIKLSDKYEKMLYELYLYISQKYNILGIEWINNKFINNQYYR